MLGKAITELRSLRSVPVSCLSDLSPSMSWPNWFEFLHQVARTWNWTWYMRGIVTVMCICPGVICLVGPDLTSLNSWNQVTCPHDNIKSVNGKALFFLIPGYPYHNLGFPAYNPSFALSKHLVSATCLLSVVRQLIVETCCLVCPNL